jgi:hypothetical protein
MKNDPSVRIGYDEPQKPSSDYKAPHLSDIIGAIRHVTSEPAYVPRNIAEQIVIYDNSAGGLNLCIYDPILKSWRFIDLSNTTPF